MVAVIPTVSSGGSHVRGTFSGSCVKLQQPTRGTRVMPFEGYAEKPSAPREALTPISEGRTPQAEETAGEPAEEGAHEQPFDYLRNDRVVSGREEALEAIPTEDVRGTGEERATEEPAGESGGADRERLAGRDLERVRSAGSVGTGEGEVSVPSEREGRTEPRRRPEASIAGNRATTDYHIPKQDETWTTRIPPIVFQPRPTCNSFAFPRPRRVASKPPYCAVHGVFRRGSSVDKMLTKRDPKNER